MEGFVYILRSRSGRFYYGSTNNLERRLADHERGHTHTTRRDAPWTLVGWRAFPTLPEARTWERTLKRWKNRERALAWLGR